jgi:hypothetical protein
MYCENEEKGSKKSGRKRMKKEFSIQFFRPPHLSVNEKPVHKIYFAIHAKYDHKKHYAPHTENPKKQTTPLSSAPSYTIMCMYS